MAVVPALPSARHRTEPVPRPSSARPLPVPALAAPPARDRFYGLAVLDQYGRLANRAVLHALDWGTGQGLALTLRAGSVLVIGDSEASIRVGRDGHLRLPVGLRRSCHLNAGDRVLLVAEPAADRLFLHPTTALDALLDPHHIAVAQGATR